MDDAFAQAQEESGQQEDEEILGFVEIPKIEQYLPIYEGTSPAILNKGVGHLTGSSLPVGGGEHPQRCWPVTAGLPAS